MVSAQARYDAQMVMGYWSSDELMINDPVLQFAADSVRIDYQRLALENLTSSCTISDQSGNLLFYFNGCSVANSYHEIIENGTGFNPGKSAEIFCTERNSAYAASEQSCLILPLDDRDSLFMIVHLTTDLVQENGIINIYGIPRYSTIDMKANDGRGRVVLKNQTYHPDTTMRPSGMTAVRHANNRDWWIVNPDQDWSSTIYTTLLRDGDLIPTVSQKMGPDFRQYPFSGFSADGTRFFRFGNYDSGLSVMDFDRETGRFSRERHLAMTQENIFAFGASFSPSGRYIYVGNGIYLMQVDAEADVLTADTIAVWDGTIAYWGQPAYFGAMQIGPDCRIYMAPGFCVPFMHVIMEPDLPGKACDVRQHFFQLKVPICSVPHFPNYRLGTPYPFCDPDIKVVTATTQYVPPSAEEMTAEIYPNPAADRMTIRSYSVIRRVSVTDMTGRVVLTPTHWPDTTWEVDISSLPPGMYLVRIDYGERYKTETKKLVIVR